MGQTQPVGIHSRESRSDYIMGNVRRLRLRDAGINPAMSYDANRAVQLLVKRGYMMSLTPRHKNMPKTNTRFGKKPSFIGKFKRSLKYIFER